MSDPVVLDIQVEPNKGAGAFAIGVPVRRAVERIQQSGMLFRDVDVTYSDDNSASSDFVFHLRPFGLNLHFDASEQRLKVIEFSRFDCVNIKHGEKEFRDGFATYNDFMLFDGAEETEEAEQNGPRQPPTLSQCIDAFGCCPSPGDFSPIDNAFTLNYKGLSIHFQVDKKYIQNGTMSPIAKRDFENSNPFVSKLFVFHGEELSHPFFPALRDGDLYMSRVNVYLNRGIELQHHRISFSSSAQDIVTELGPPDSVLVKDKESGSLQSSSAALVMSHAYSPSCSPSIGAVKANSPNMPGLGLGAPMLDDDSLDLGAGAGASGGADRLPPSSTSISSRPRSFYPDYFFNYFELGFDLLFDGTSHKVKKIILHTNLIGTADFQKYNKCNFVLAVDTSPSSSNPPAVPELSSSKKKKKSGSGSKGGSRLLEAEDVPSISEIRAHSHWSEIEKRMGPAGAPRKQIRPRRQDPFGPSSVYAYNGVLFEVMPNGCLSTVTLFDAEALNELSSIRPNRKK